MAHIDYLEPKQIDVKIIHEFLTKHWDVTCIIVFRKNEDRRIYELVLKQEHDCITYNLYRLDGYRKSHIRGTPFRRCQNEDFFKKFGFFGSRDKIVKIDFFDKDYNHKDYKLNELKKVFPDAYIQGEAFDWSKCPDITTISYQELLSLIQSYKNTGKEIYFDKIKKLFDL